jgi:hypothetical protein
LSQPEKKEPVIAATTVSGVQGGFMYRSRGTIASSSWTFRLDPAGSAARWQDLVVESGDEGLTRQPFGTVIEVNLSAILDDASPTTVSAKAGAVQKAARLTKTAAQRQSDRHCATTVTTWRSKVFMLTFPLAVSPSQG